VSIRRGSKRSTQRGYMVCLDAGAVGISFILVEFIVFLIFAAVSGSQLIFYYQTYLHTPKALERLQ
jgi:hypothetical protein